MSAGQDRQADGVNVFLNGGGDDLFRRLTQACIDHFHPGVAEGAGDDLGTAVVTVEARLGNQNADLPVSHWVGSCAGGSRKTERMTRSCHVPSR